MSLETVPTYNRDIIFSAIYTRLGLTDLRDQQFLKMQIEYRLLKQKIYQNKELLRQISLTGRTNNQNGCLLFFTNFLLELIEGYRRNSPEETYQFTQNNLEYCQLQKEGKEQLIADFTKLYYPDNNRLPTAIGNFVNCFFAQLENSEFDNKAKQEALNNLFEAYKQEIQQARNKN